MWKRSPSSLSSLLRTSSWHYVKTVQIRIFFWSVFSRIRTRNNSVFTDFSCSVNKIDSIELIHLRLFQKLYYSNASRQETFRVCFYQYYSDLSKTSTLKGFDISKLMTFEKITQRSQILQSAWRGMYTLS